MKIRLYILTFSLLCLILGNGCTGQKLPPDLPELYPCQITIHDKDGKPMQTVLVSVNPVDPTNRWGGSGQTNASGIAEILTAGQYRGLSAGNYRVTLKAYEHTSTGKFDDTGNEIVHSKNLMPVEYTNSSSTPFQFEMEPKATTLTFQLEK